MCDYFDDFEGEFMDDEPFEEDIEEDFDESEVEDSLDDESELDESIQDDSKDDNAIDIGWEEIAMFGAFSQEIADEQKERRKFEREMGADRKNRKRKNNENLK